MKHANYFSTSARLLTIAAFAASSIFMMSCDPEEEEEVPTKTVLELVQADPELSILAGLLEEYELEATLSSSSANLTLFAPSNAAMTSLLTTLGLDSFDPVAADIALAVLTYHVSATSYTKASLPASILTLEGENITVTDGELITGATDPSVIVKADVKATNGVIHYVDVVLVPPTVGAAIVDNIGKLTQPILLGADFTILNEGLAKADAFATAADQPTVSSFLTGVTKHTIFAPVDGVFIANSLTAESFNGQQWYGILLNHIVVGDIAGGDITAPSQLTTLLGGTLTVLTLDAPTDPSAGITSGIAISSDVENDAEGQVAVEDAFVGGNGRLHALAGLFLPQ